MKHKLTLMLIALSLLVVAFLVSEVYSSPFVPLEWQQSVRSGELEDQRKHIKWSSDSNGDFVDDAFAELAPDDRTDVLIQLNDCLCKEEVANTFSGFGTVKRIGKLVAYIYMEDVLVRDLPELAKNPYVAAVERPEDFKASLDTSTRTVRQRASVTYTSDTFEDNFSFNGTGINIAIADSGVDDGHIAFAGKYLTGYNALTNTPVNPDDDWTGIFHGTHVAGIAMGLGVGPGCRNANDGSSPNNCAGMATGASLIDVKVLNSSGSSVGNSLLDGIEWIWLDGQADIVNMSLNGSTNNDGTSTVSKAINALVANDIAVAVSSGNSGANIIDVVAAAELAVTVGNSNDQGTVDRDNDIMNSSSSFGPRMDMNTFNPRIGMLKPDIVAPGTSISSAQGNTLSGYHQLTGTSMSSPHVAGAMALLLEMRSDLPPGAMKDILRRTAYFTPAHSTAGASYPSVDSVYNVNWGMGLLDLFEAADLLQYGITDISFCDCSAPHPNYPDARRCLITGGRPSYANDTDITLATDPFSPVQGQPNTIFICIENRGTATAQRIVVSVGVKDFGVGVLEFYDVGSKEVNTLGPGVTTTVDFPWTPSASSHQCIQATIDYGFDTDYWNNLTQRNVNPVPSSSQAKATFRLENPLNELAMINLDVFLDGYAKRYFEFDLIGPTQPIYLNPGDCPLLYEIVFLPNQTLPIGTTGTFNIRPVAFSESHSDGIELSGVVFKVTAVAAGLQRAYSCARHQLAGEINIPLVLAGRPSSDSRRMVKKIKAIFNVPVKPLKVIPLENAILISSYQNNPIPSFDAFFEDGGTSGTTLVIEFEQPLINKDRYTFSFNQFGDLDGDRLQGDYDFQLRVLQGDVNNSGTVTATDISFVRGRINQEVMFGGTSRADVNLTGTITATDVSFVRGRIGDSAP